MHVDLISARRSESLDHRLAKAAVAGLFFLDGLCFSSWGSRIPAIQDYFALSEAALGSVLLAIPVGCIVSMPIAAYLVGRFGSRRILLLGMILYAAFLAFVGFAGAVSVLVGILAAFGFASNLVNVALNTQAVELEALSGRALMAQMHGLWSVAGFTGAALGAVMIALGVLPRWHFASVFVAVVVLTAIGSRYLLRTTSQKIERETSRFRLPEKSLFVLGLMAFCSMLCEGGMFDWAGVYFKKVIGAEGAYVSAGYIAFMTTMAGTRFIADGLKVRFGLRRVLMVSGGVIFTGYMTAVLLPHPLSAVFGFFIIGCGVSAVVPLVFSEAGKSVRTKPSTAVATVSTIGFFGFLIGPPMIGWVAGLSSLRVSFAIIACVGIGISFLATRIGPRTASSTPSKN